MRFKNFLVLGLIVLLIGMTSALGLLDGVKKVKSIDCGFVEENSLGVEVYNFKIDYGVYYADGVLVHNTKGLNDAIISIVGPNDYDVFNELINEEIEFVKQGLIDGKYYPIKDKEYGDENSDLFLINSPGVKELVPGLKYYFRKKGNDYEMIGIADKNINGFFVESKSEQIDRISKSLKFKESDGNLKDVGYYGRNIRLFYQEKGSNPYFGIDRWYKSHGPDGTTYPRFENPYELMSEFIVNVGSSSDPKNLYMIAFDDLGNRFKIAWKVRKIGKVYEIDFYHADLHRLN